MMIQNFVAVAYVPPNVLVCLNQRTTPLCFVIRADFLKETVPYLGEDPTIGIVQTPQFFRRRKEQTWVEQGAGVSQEFFYRMVQVGVSDWSTVL